MPLPVELQVREEALSIVILGATGDLATKKLIPTLYRLFAQKFLPPMTSIIGYARSEYTSATWREALRVRLSEGGPLSPQTVAPGVQNPLETALMGCEYVRAPQDYATAESLDDSLETLVEVLQKREQMFPSAKAYNRIFYLALPYDVWPHVLAPLKAKCMGNKGFSRVVLEKPFGQDDESSAALSTLMRRLNYQEDQLYRVDRYLGKEIMENLLVMRFANRFLSPLWNRDNIKTVQIIFKEPFGAEDQGRISYFDKQGIIRDVVQNHLMQALALVAMEKPASLSEADIRDEKLKVLKCIRPIRLTDVCLGQYTEGNGHRGYKDHPLVPESSHTPTFAMMVFEVRNERWDGVPFILKAGKGINEKRSEIRIQLREVPGDLFSTEKFQGPNEFVLRMQPEEELYLKMTIKKPGLGMHIVPSEMQLSEKWKQNQVLKSEMGISPRRAFERLIMDIIHGQQAHFVRHDELAASWKIITPLLKSIDAGQAPMYNYAYGSRGPTQAEKLRSSTGHTSTVSEMDMVPLGSSEDLQNLHTVYLKNKLGANMTNLSI
mmetsp:Transcript_2419/g.4944  ORF Transcript_2419/g.4944 Transcript_2419/m.4944 type:complete len:549 (-) Transcript_2419:147-1793(-)